MQPGRNDPCPCGSEKKFKKCCFMNNEPKAEDLFWHRQHSMRNELIIKIMKHVATVYGRDAINEAWNEFNLTENELFNQNTHHIQIFMPWFFYNWTPDRPDSNLNSAAPDVPPARSLLDSKDGRHLDALEREYIEACFASSFSFFEILNCNPGHGFELKIFSPAKNSMLWKKVDQCLPELATLFLDNPLLLVT
ncbi:MAG: SEC-C metal-binding domain-containing protein [Oligoflexia bacterium]|nr:SEC-C metal-binding domain-containing protein [Oligoflexia bacterium]